MEIVKKWIVDNTEFNSYEEAEEYCYDTSCISSNVEAMKYLYRNDISLEKTIKLISELDIPLEELNICILASVLNEHNKILSINEQSYRFMVRDREAGNEIDCFYTYEDAEFAIEQYEREDKQGGAYTPYFYEIVEIK